MNKALVAYFSVSGVTAKVAKKLAKEIGAELFEIEPKIPYTNEDINWRNSKSRSSIEMNDKNCRPEIRYNVENMNQYNIVFIGFPIWWYREPSIIDTFIEAYDFSKKRIIPFATSGGSPIGDICKNIKYLASEAKVMEGKLITEDVSEKILADWASEWL